VIKPEHLVALAYANDAERALTLICERASAYVQDRWAAKPVDYEAAAYTGEPAFSWNYYEAWNLDDTQEALNDLWLDWNAVNDPAHEHADGRSLLFISGLAANQPEQLVIPEPGTDRQRLLEGGISVEGQRVQFERLSDGCERFGQIAFPEQVLVGRSLEEQADALGAWVVAGFTALTAPLDQLIPRPEDTAGPSWGRARTSSRGAAGDNAGPNVEDH
jgi:hypothetical protein